MSWGGNQSVGEEASNPGTLAFIVLMAAFMFALDKVSKKIPTAFAGLAAGILVFYGLGRLVPGIDLGRTIGTLSIEIPPTSPLSELGVPGIEQALLASWQNILFVLFAIAVIAILETLLVYRARQHRPN
jgi:MFS superfamily sulfate permease-like transporter